MAAGIDGFGHQGALEGGGKTFGILGGGVDIKICSGESAIPAP